MSDVKENTNNVKVVESLKVLTTKLPEEGGINIQVMFNEENMGLIESIAATLCHVKAANPHITKDQFIDGIRKTWDAMEKTFSLVTPDGQKKPINAENATEVKETTVESSNIEVSDTK